MGGSDGTVRREERNGVLVVTIDRPEVRNALDLPTAQALAAALDELDNRDDLRVGVLTGAGGTFCSGMDLKAFAHTGLRPEVPGRGLGGLTRHGTRTPLIAAVEGFAIGGGFELVLACDLAVAAHDAVFGLPEVRRGLVAGSGGLLRLPRRIPPAIAMELALTGHTLDATSAARWGLLNRLSAPGQALEVALELAADVAEGAPAAVAAGKQLVGRTAAMPWEAAMAEQDAILERLAASDDAREGAVAFAEKRSPRWSGH